MRDNRHHQTDARFTWVQDWRMWVGLVVIVVLLSFPVLAIVTARIIPAYTNIITRSRLDTTEVVEARIIDRVEVWDADESGVTYQLTWEFEIVLSDGIFYPFTGTQLVSSYEAELVEVGDTVMVVYNFDDPSISMVRETAEFPLMDWVWALAGALLLLLMAGGLVNLALYGPPFWNSSRPSTARQWPQEQAASRRMMRR